MKSSDKKILTTLGTVFGAIIVLGAGLGIWLYYWQGERVKDNVLLPPRSAEISEYSLGGKVVKVEGNRLTITAGIVTKAPEGNVVVYRDKTALVSNETELIGFSRLSDLKYNNSVVVYTNSEPYTVSEFSVSKIELVK